MSRSPQDQSHQDQSDHRHEQYSSESYWISGRRLLETLPTKLEVVVEIPRWSFVKRDSKGNVEFVAPLPTLYNYGSIPGYLGGDGQPLDAIVLGKRLSVGSVKLMEVRGVVEFVDGGVWDHKLIVGAGDHTCRSLPTFFFFYAIFKRMRVWIRGASSEIRYVGIVWATGSNSAISD